MSAKLQIRNSADNPDRKELCLYGPIGDDYDGISAKTFCAQLDELGPVPELGVRINSIGGYVQDGFAIYNRLKDHGAKIIVDVDAFAVSIASVIAMAGDTIRMHENALMMIHKPSGFAWGDADALRKEAEVLDLMQSQIAGVYQARTGQDAKTVNDWIDAETWMSAKEALDRKFCNEVVPNGPGPSENPDGDEPPPGPSMHWKNCPAWAAARLQSRAAAIASPQPTWRRNLLKRRLALLEKECTG